MHLIPKRTYATLLKDKHWDLIDGELIRVSTFSPLLSNSAIDGGVTSNNSNAPYASIIVDCKKLPQDVKVTGYITHKVDFSNLWYVFKDRGVTSNEEVLAYWTRKHYINRAAKLLSITLPKLVIIIAPKGTYQATAGKFSWPQDDEALTMIYGLEAIEWRIPDVIR